MDIEAILASIIGFISGIIFIIGFSSRIIFSLLNYHPTGDFGFWFWLFFHDFNILVLSVITLILGAYLYIKGEISF